MRERLVACIDEAVARLLAEASAEAGSLPAISVEAPRQAEHGDFACNAALVLAKPLRKPPREIAGRLVELLGEEPGLVERAEIAGPGFVNIWLAGDGWHALLAKILEAGAGFGRSDAGRGQRVQVEFVSANPTGPLSIGHGRQAVLGDCIARLLAGAGYEVTREYYFNDGGRQMRVLGASVKARYLEQLGRAAPPPGEALRNAEAPWPEEIEGLPVAFPRDGYQGDYVGEIAAGLVAEHGEALLEEAPEGRFRSAAEDLIFAGIRETCARLGIVFDVFFNEKTLYDEGKLQEVVEGLREKGLVYESEDAVWLRSTEFGLERDRVLIRGTGEPTYLLPDIAYHCEKMRRGFDTVIDVQGADHFAQFPYVAGAAAALGCDAERIELVMHQFVTLTSEGRTVKQSTRAATFVTVDEVLEQIGTDVFRFFMIQRRPEAHLDFDLDLARETDWTKNPAYYLQYAHARCCGIARQAAERGVPAPVAGAIDAAPLVLAEETALIKKLAELPDVAARAAATREPHHVAYYLRDVAGLWNPYVQDGTHHRVLSDDAALTQARLALCAAVRTVLANGLGLLGMSAPERM